MESSVMKETITRLMKKLKDIDGEIKRSNDHISKLKDEKTKVEENLQKIMEEWGLPGFKYMDLTVVAKDYKKRLPLKKNEKLQRGINALEEAGIHNGEEILPKILESMKGEIIVTKKLSRKIEKDN
jgi:hypothetical protein